MPLSPPQSRKLLTRLRLDFRHLQMPNETSGTAFVDYVLSLKRSVHTHVPRSAPSVPVAPCIDDRLQRADSSEDTYHEIASGRSPCQISSKSETIQRGTCNRASQAVASIYECHPPGYARGDRRDCICVRVHHLLFRAHQLTEGPRGSLSDRTPRVSARITFWSHHHPLPQRCRLRGAVVCGSRDLHGCSFAHSGSRCVATPPVQGVAHWPAAPDD